MEKGEQIFVVAHAQHENIFWWGNLWNLWRSQVCSFLSSSCAYWLERRVWIRLITHGCWAPFFFSTVHKLKNRFLSLSLTHTQTHTHTHTQTHRHTDTHTHPSILRSHSGLLDLFPIVFFKLPVVHINYISFCSFFLPLFVIFSLLEKAFSWNIQI